MADAPFTAASFDTFISQKKVMAARCKKCGNLILPPRNMCGKCYSDQLQWEEVAGKGKLISFTVIGVGPTPMINEGYNRDNPYCSGVVQLEAGPRVCTQILGVDVAHPENIKLNMPLVADFVERGSYSLVPAIANVKKTYLAFRPAK